MDEVEKIDQTSTRHLSGIDGMAREVQAKDEVEEISQTSNKTLVWDG